MNLDTVPQKTVEVNIRFCDITVYLRSGVSRTFPLTGALNWLQERQPGYRGPMKDGVVLDPDDYLFHRMAKPLVTFWHQAGDGQGGCAKTVFPSADIQQLEFTKVDDHWKRVTVPKSTRFGLHLNGRFEELEQRIKLISADPDPAPTKSRWKFWA